MDAMSEGPVSDRPTPADPPRLRAGDHDYRAFVGPPERYDLIAAMTGLSPENVGVRLHRARARLTAQSREDAPDAAR